MTVVDLNITLPKLYPKQHAAMYDPARYSVIEASTKSGKTVSAMCWMLDKAFAEKPDRNLWWVAPVFPQSMIAYRRCKTMLRVADPDQQFWSSNETERYITVNGSPIWYKSADKPDSLYGEDVYALTVDEASRVKEDAWHACRSVITATRGPVRIIGNVKGRKNWFYNLARRAQNGEPDMAWHKLTAWDAVDAGVLALGEVEDARRLLPDSVFKELYLAEPGEDHGNPFGIAAIRDCVGPLSSEAPYVWGVDLAKYRDWTVAIALDRTGKVCRFFRWQSDWRNTTDRLIKMIKRTPALLDSSGVGDPIVEEIARDCPRANGETFTVRRKQQLMTGLQSAIQQREVGFPEGIIQQELEDFQYEVIVKEGRVTNVQMSAPAGLHDDAVCSLALAVECFNERPTPVKLDVVSAWEDDDAWS